MVDETVPWTTAPEYVRRLVPRLDLSHDAWQTAYRLAREYDGEFGIKPRSIAAGAVYWAGLLHNEKVTQAELSEASEVSTTTIGRAYREIAEAEGIEVEPSKRTEQAEQTASGWSVRLPGSIPAAVRTMALPMAMAMVITVWLMNSVPTEAFTDAVESIETYPVFDGTLLNVALIVVVVAMLATFLGPVVRWRSRW